jgi:septum formation protein
VHDKSGLVLASGSPRRRELLGLGDWEYSVVVSDVDETQKPGETPNDYVQRLSREKARAVAARVDPDCIVIAADTAVVDGPEILGKPKDTADAERMLRQLRGRVHQVYTGLTVLRPMDEKMVTELCVTDVPMRSYSDEEITAYVNSGDPMDKAGAYAIQHPEFKPVESLGGCRASVMGLPMCHVVRVMKRFDVRPGTDMPAACQSLLKYECPVFSAILRGETAG